MIPVPNDVYKRIVFDELSDERYQDLFEKEYAFCLTIKDKILTKAEKMKRNQHGSSQTYSSVDYFYFIPTFWCADNRFT